MRQLEGVRSSKIYHCHLSKEVMELFFCVENELSVGIESEDGQGVGFN